MNMNLIKSSALTKAALILPFFAISTAFASPAGTRASVAMDTLAAQWEHVSVATGITKEKATIHELLSAFHRHWPTGVFGKLIQDEKGVMDIKNGYAEVQFHNPETDSVEVGVATIWRRKNGHTLLGITIDRNISDFGTSQIVMFYDYNPATGNLVPEKSYAGCQIPESHKALRPVIELPRQGKNIEVTEFNPEISISLRHTCTFNGMNHKYASTVIETDVDFIGLLPPQAQEYDVDLTPSYYTFYDIDRDGYPELWLTDLTGDYQQMYSVKEKTQLLGWSDYKTHFRFFPGVLANSGGCGTMCFITVYTTIRDSRPVDYLNEITSGDFEGNQVVTYTVGNLDEGSENTTEIPVREGAEKVRTFGLPYEDDLPEWHRVRKVLVRGDRFQR